MVRPLGDLSVKVFMRDYWQQRPLLIQGAFKDYAFPVGRDEVLEMAQDEFEDPCTLIREQGERTCWQVDYGPLAPEEIPASDGKPWTVLVRGGDRMQPSLTDVLEFYRFIPNWRLQDLQVSFAAPGGSAGPHHDRFDVFLIQADGTRVWKIESSQSSEMRPYVPHAEIPALADFEPDQEWVVEPGDVLYLPPMHAHWGIAESECVTYSVGFRMPRARHVLRWMLDEARLEGSLDGMYSDQGRAPTSDPGLVGEEVIDWAQGILQRVADDREAIAAAFCRQQSNDDYFEPELMLISYAEVAHHLRNGATLYRVSAASFLYRPCGDSVNVYVLGRVYTVSKRLIAFVRLITGARPLDADSVLPHMRSRVARELLLKLIFKRALYLVAPSESS